MADPTLAARLRALGNGRHADPTGVPAPPFPAEALPPAIRRYAESAAESLAVPVEMVAAPMLALAGALIGNRLHLVVKPSWRAYPGLYLAVVARPGSAKSPALDFARWPLDVLQRDAHERHRAALTDHETRLDAWKAEGKKRGDEKPAPPTPRHYFSTDLTIEALAGILDGSPGVAVVRDEISGWVAAMDQYKAGGKGSERQQYLSLWSSQPLKVDRKGGGSVYVPAPVASVVGGIQPDLAGELHDAAQRRDGFVERLLPVVPDVAPAPWTDAAPTPAICGDALAVFRAIDRSLGTLDGDRGDLFSDGAAAGYGVALDREAREQFVAWFNENQALVAGADGLASGFFAKLPSHVARFALILHGLANPHDPRGAVGGERMADAIALGEFFRAHIVRFLALLGATAPARTAGAQARILRILRNSEAANADRWASRSDLYNALRNVAGPDLTEALHDLLGRGAVERRQLPGTTKPTEQWRLRKDLTPRDYSDYSDYPAPQGGKSENSESQNGIERVDRDGAVAGLVAPWEAS